MTRFYHPDGVDLVDLGDIRVFMLKNDNLYNHAVPEGRKNASLETHYNAIHRSGGYTPAPIDRAGLRETREAKFVLYKVVDHFLRHHPGFKFYDVGAFVGEVALRYANYCRTVGERGKFECFDPTIAGDLIPYNIVLNGLHEYVGHWSCAASHMVGPIGFYQAPGQIDSSSSVFAGGEKNTVVPSMRLMDMLEGPAIIKLDTENLEAMILHDCMPYLKEVPNAVCIEVNLSTPGLKDELQALSETHWLWDIGYVPKPFRARLVEKVADLETVIDHMPYGYTDVLAVRKSEPLLLEAIASTYDEPRSYTLAY